MALTPEQNVRVDGIIERLNDLLDKRFAQARRVSPFIGRVEADMRINQVAVTRLVLESAKGFGPIRVQVCDILAGHDEIKRKALFDVVDQVCIMREIVPADEEASQERTAGKLAIRDIKSFYSALNPDFERILTLLQTWMWWDLLDASEEYRFGTQLKVIESLKTVQIDQAFIENYRKEMGAKPGVEITRQDMIKFELGRTKDLVGAYSYRRGRDPGHEIISVMFEREGTPEADAACVRLAKRIMAIDKLSAQGTLEDNVKQFYAQQIGLAADKVTSAVVLQLEEKNAKREREQLVQALETSVATGKAGNYKNMKLAEMNKKFDAMCASLGASTKPVAQ